MLQHRLSFIRLCFFAFIITAFFIFLSGYYAYRILQQPVITQFEPVLFLVPQNGSTQKIIATLYDMKLIPHLDLMKLYLKLKPAKALKFGEYEFTRGASIVDIWYQIEQGRGLHQRSITFIPGWTFSQVKQALKNAPGVVHTINALSELELLNRLHASTHRSMEGLVFPDTYRYTWGTKDTVILEQAVRLMQQKLMQHWSHRAVNLPYISLQEALVAASLIEKEVQLSSERPLVASVLVNRLRLGMPLQIDPTVIYALGASYTGKLYKRDLQYASLHNTYLHKGLPPTPIAIPSESSVRAALNPAQTSFLYFVARPDQSGAHRFSTTLEQHNKAVVSYRQNQLFDYFNSDLILKRLKAHFMTTREHAC